MGKWMVKCRPLL